LTLQALLIDLKQYVNDIKHQN